MKAPALRCAALAAAALVAQEVLGQVGDPRLREVVYDPRAIVTVSVRRGVVTHIVLGADESLTDVGAGLGGDCSKPEAAWCIAAQAGARNIFVKPKSTASAPNNLAVVTDRRTHAFRFVVLDDADKRVPVYRLTVRSPAARPIAAARPVPRDPDPGVALRVGPPRPSPISASRPSSKRRRRM